METNSEKENKIVEFSNYLIQNLVNIKKKNKVEKIKLNITNRYITIYLDNQKHKITNLIEYKNLIDELSLEYRMILKYFPKYTNHFNNSIIILK